MIQHGAMSLKQPNLHHCPADIITEPWLPESEKSTVRSHDHWMHVIHSCFRSMTVLSAGGQLWGDSAGFDMTVQIEGLTAVLQS